MPLRSRQTAKTLRHVTPQVAARKKHHRKPKRGRSEAARSVQPFCRPIQ